MEFLDLLPWADRPPFAGPSVFDVLAFQLTQLLGL
jgi:hypothetical protein